MPTDLTLNRRAAACKHFRWMPGMRESEGWICMGVEPEGWPLFYVLADGELRFYGFVGRVPRGLTPGGLTPDLTDPATLGCLLALVREAWGRPGLTTKHHEVLGWIVIDGRDDFLKGVAAATEAEALVCALEAAPSAPCLT
jgi:hypothetical protein